MQPQGLLVTASQPGEASWRMNLPTAGRTRFVVAVEWVVLLMGVVYFAGYSLPRGWRRLNTDFPNYYITARLQREGFSTQRLFEWIWFQRQKDHMGISRADQPVVGFVPDTPISALVVWPLTYWSPLTAKRFWIVINLGFLAIVAALLQSLTALGWRRIALLMMLNFPLYRNLEYGQYYIFLLLVLTLASWLYVRRNPVLAGMVVALGFGLKIFPILFLLYFARKKDMRAVAGVIAGIVATSAASIWAFGLQLHRVYISQILPWALRGEALDPYNLVSNSLSSLLHKLLLFEPEWNPHPIVHSPALFSILHPLLQMSILAPAILLVTPGNYQSRQLRVEWSAFIIALLAISTLPASYHFTLLILPIALLCGVVFEEQDWQSLALLVVLYLAICFPAWSVRLTDRWWALLAVPRLYFVILLCVTSYVILARQEHRSPSMMRGRWLWVGLLAVAVVVECAATFHHQRGLYSNHVERIRTSPSILMAANPAVRNDSVFFIGMLAAGYRAGERSASGIRLRTGGYDQLSQAATADGRWIEDTGPRSRIMFDGMGGAGSSLVIENAEAPAASADGRWLGYLRSEKGRSTLWTRSLMNNGGPEVSITPSDLDVLEMTLLSDHTVVFSAATRGTPPRLFAADMSGEIRQLPVGEARYPASSPDSHWLAYSRMDRGVWNLWLRNMQTGEVHRITDKDCNNISPAWAADSQTLIYASDCGRALWFTALYKLRVVP